MRRFALALLVVLLAAPVVVGQIPTNYPGGTITVGTANITTANINQPYLVQSDSTNQFVATAGTAQLVTFDTSDLLSGITKTSTSRFTIATAGTYRIFISAIADSTTTPNKHLEIFLKVDGTAVPRSNTIVQIPSTNTEMTVAVEIIYNFTAGQYFEWFINADESGGRVGITATAAGSTQSNVASPSIIMAASRIGT